MWRRLRLVALEEVSVADLELVARVLAIAGKRVLHRRIGECALLTFLTAHLAMTPKCRTPCDLLVWLPPIPGVDLTTSDGPAINASFLSGDLVELRRTAALWKSIAAHSVRTRAGWRSVSRGDAYKRDEWLEITGMPSLVRYIVQRGGSTDALNVLLVPAYQLAQCGAQRITSGAPSHTSIEEIGGVPAYAYCVFSEPGRAALRRFLAGNDQWHKHFRECGVHDPIRALGYLVFHVEGGYCREVLSVSRSPEIKLLSEIASLQRFGVPEEQVLKLQQGMAADLPLLNAARRETVSVKP